MIDILTKLNHRMASNNRSILLMMDNAGCHPDDLKSKFSNIRVCFLPANTTSRLQPLDLGIIQNFKVHYRHHFLRYVLSKIDECATASEVTNSVNILVAIRWVAMAWSMVKPDTVMKCFRKAGILDSTMNTVSYSQDEEDPFEEVDIRMEMQEMIDATLTDGCDVNEFCRGDDDLSICDDYVGDDWEVNFLKELEGKEDKDIDADETDDIEDEIDVPDDKDVHIFKEAIIYLEHVDKFLGSRKGAEEARSAIIIGLAVDTLARVKVASSSTRQTTLFEFQQ